MRGLYPRLHTRPDALEIKMSVVFAGTWLEQRFSLLALLCSPMCPRMPEICSNSACHTASYIVSRRVHCHLHRIIGLLSAATVFSTLQHGNHLLLVVKPGPASGILTLTLFAGKPRNLQRSRLRRTPRTSRGRKRARRTTMMSPRVLQTATSTARPSSERKACPSSSWSVAVRSCGITISRSGSVAYRLDRPQ